VMATESVRASGFAEVIERLIDVGGSPWTLIFADILAPSLLNDGGVINAEAQTVVADYLKRVPPGSVAWARLAIADVHLLALVLPDTQTCRLYTPGMAQEAFLGELSGDAALQAHLDAIDQHPPTFTTIDEVTAKYELVPLRSPAAAVAGRDRAVLVDSTRRQVEALIHVMEAYKPSRLERLQDWFLEVIAADQALLRQVLRFVAVLPSLRFDRSGREVTRVLRENLRLLRHAQQQRRGTWPRRCCWPPGPPPSPPEPCPRV
jgi:hypothetical protein